MTEITIPVNWISMFVILMTLLLGYFIWLVREFFIRSNYRLSYVLDEVSKLNKQVDGLEANLGSMNLSIHQHLGSIQNTINSEQKDGDYNWMDKSKEPVDD